MATVRWNPNGQATAQVDTLTVTAVALGATLTATINGKTITYTCTGTDTTSTAASAWQAILASGAAPPEFREVAWTVSANVVTGTAQAAGMPFTLAASAAGGGGVTLAHPTPNSSPADVANPANWLRNGAPSLPQAGDDLVLADTAVPLLWNLDALANIPLASVTRWQTMTGQIGLATQNPSGYVEYRPTRLQLKGQVASSPSGSGSSSSGVSGVLGVTLGFGSGGSGPAFERYDVQGQWTRWTVLGAQAADWVGTNVANTLTLVAGSVAVAPLAGDVAALAQATVNGGGSLSLGPGCACGPVTLTGAALTSLAAPSSVTALGGSVVTLLTAAAGLAVTSVRAAGGSTVVWRSDAQVGTLLLQTSSTFDASGDVRALTIVNATLDGDTCFVRDPNARITFVNAVTVNNNVTGGPLQLGYGPRAWKVT